VERRIIETGDGSKTIQLVDWNEQYHSVHGALQEAKHVFIKHLREYLEVNWNDTSDVVHVFEMGFGTGLNALLTAQFAKETTQNIHYTTLEAYPISKEEIESLNYASMVEDKEGIYNKQHEVEWEQDQKIHNHFTLLKRKGELHSHLFDGAFDVVFYDAFGPRVQPDLWTIPIFEKVFSAMNKGGALFTYCAKGEVRRNMIAAGFEVSRMPGPPGKREMLVAKKP
jgi:tRNA U34 5-methylaminomethyl-2-thiouridine-forming methyltransferase MnmC